jgi:hypothetical protein
LDGIWSPEPLSPEPLRKLFQFILSIAFGIGKLCQEPRTRFPADFALVIEAAHRISAFLVSPQDLRNQLTFGEINGCASSNEAPLLRSK